MISALSSSVPIQALASIQRTAPYYQSEPQRQYKSASTVTQQSQTSTASPAQQQSKADASRPSQDQGEGRTANEKSARLLSKMFQQSYQSDSYSRGQQAISIYRYMERMAGPDISAPYPEVRVSI